jgi:hypothetical protein
LFSPLWRRERIDQPENIPEKHLKIQRMTKWYSLHFVEGQIMFSLKKEQHAGGMGPGSWVGDRKAKCWQ